MIRKHEANGGFYDARPFRIYRALWRKGAAKWKAQSVYEGFLEETGLPDDSLQFWLYKG